MFGNIYLYDLEQQWKELAERRKKKYITLEEFAQAKSLTAIRDVIPHCKYPEDDESPSGKSFLPILIVRRCKIIAKGKYYSEDLNEDMLNDLLLAEKWIQFLPERDQFMLYYLQTYSCMRVKLYLRAEKSLAKAEEILSRTEDLYSESELQSRKEKLFKAKMALKEARVTRPSDFRAWRDMEVESKKRNLFDL
jgi:hypothetical protein